MKRDPLRFYPREWRARYGEEMRALLDDDLDGRSPTRRYLMGLVVSGLRERARAAGYAGDSSARARRWAGSSLVLYAWVVVCAAGGSFAKLAEHYRSALTAGQRLAPTLAFDTMVAGAVAGGVLIAAGAAVALPGFAAAVRRGDARGLSRPLWLAVATTVVAGAGTVGVAVWAHGLDVAQRNGADAAYSAAVVAWAIVGVAALALWARFASRAARLTISERALRLEAGLAVSVAAAALIVIVAGGWWWAEMATRAPVFLSGSPQASLVTVRSVGTLALAAMAAAASLAGVARLASARR